MKLGEIIRQYRREKNMTLVDFSQKSGITNSYLSRLENDKNSRGTGGIVPSLYTYKRCAIAMEMTLDELLMMIDGDEVVSLATKPEEEEIHFHYVALAKLLDMDVNDIARAVAFARDMKK